MMLRFLSVFVSLLYLLVSLPSLAFCSSVTQNIAITKSGSELRKSSDGTVGIYFTVTANGVGLLGKEVVSKVTIRQPNGNHIKATAKALKSTVKADSTLQWTHKLKLDKDPCPFNLWTFMPLNVMELPAGQNRLILRQSIYSGKVGTYYDAEVVVTPNGMKFVRGVMLGNLQMTADKQTFSTPNVSGAGMGPANFQTTTDILSFSSANNAVGVKNQKFYTGVCLKYANGGYVKPSTKCPKTNIGAKGQVQVERQNIIGGDNVNWKSKPLTVPLDWLALDRSKPQDLIAIYYTSSQGLWNVRELAITVPKTVNGLNDIKIFDATSSGAGRNNNPVGPQRPNGQQTGNGQTTDRTLPHTMGDGGLFADPNAQVDRSAPDMTAPKGLFDEPATPTDGGRGLFDDPTTPAGTARGRAVTNDFTRRADSSVTDERRRDFRNSKLKQPINVTQFTAPLRALLRELKNIDQGLALQKNTGAKPSPEVVALGKRLVAAGRAYISIQNKQKSTHARFGTLEEQQLIDAITATHEMASRRLYNHVIKSVDLQKLRAEAEANSGKTAKGVNIFERIDGWQPLGFIKPKTLLQHAAKTVIEEKAVEWVEERGLGILLTPTGESIVTQKVGKKLQLDLKGAVDRKVKELTGMPIGGFRSMKAAIRLQVRRQLKEQVAKFLLNYTGNALIVSFLGKRIVSWLENDLFPKLREEFRQKGNLDARTTRTLQGVNGLYSEYYQLFGPGKDPRNINVDIVAARLNRRKSTLSAATSYLKKDIVRAQRTDLDEKLTQAFSKLNSFVDQRVTFQLLIKDEDFWKDLNDKFEFTNDMHRDIVLIMSSLDIPATSPLIVKMDKKGRTTTLSAIKTIDTLGFYYSSLTDFTRLSFYAKEPFPATENGITRLVLRTDSGNMYNIYGVTDGKSKYFTARIPLFLHQNRSVRFDIVSPARVFDPISWQGKIDSLKTAKMNISRQQIVQGLNQLLPKAESELSKINNGSRLDHITSSTLAEGAKNLILLGVHREAARLAQLALKHYIRAEKMGSGNIDRHAEMLHILACAAAANKQFNQYIQYKNQELSFLDRNVIWLKNKRFNASIAQREAITMRFETAEEVLTFTGNEKLALQYFQQGRRMEQAAGMKPSNSTFASDYPALYAILKKHKLM